MSASILWEPVSKSKKSLGVSTPSSFITAMSNAGHTLPCTMEVADIPTLRGMAAVFGDVPHNPYADLIDLIEEHGAITLEAQY